jgi:Plasmid encoded RepA protein
MARLFAQTSMPYRDPGDVPGWGRFNGLVSLGIQPGVTFDPSGRPRSLGVPYGTYPRLLLAWVSREAVHTRERTLILGHSLPQFMRELGLLPGGGRWGAITRLREQMKRLFAARITCTHVSPEAFGLRNVQIADEALLWWDPKDPAQAALWQSTVTLSAPFFREIVTRPVPIDIRVLRRLKDSPMRLGHLLLAHPPHGRAKTPGADRLGSA